MSQEEMVLNFLRAKAKTCPSIERMALFGSRARKDNKARSDFDIGVYAEKIADGTWARFCVNVNEEAPTLCGIDLVLVADTMSEELKKRIVEEGVVFYEKG